MTPRSPLARYVLAVAAGWVLLGTAGVYYARSRSIALPVALPLIAAFLLEYAFYLVPGLERLRQWLVDRLPVVPYATLLMVSALAPYLVYSLPTGCFDRLAFARLFVLTGALCFWYVFRRPSLTADLAVLVLLAAVLVAKVFTRIYLSPLPGLRIEVLGHLMLIRVAALVMLTVREVKVAGFGFLPTRAEWRTGLRWFLYFVPVGLPLALALGVVRFEPTWKDARASPLVFLGILWVVALSEEFFFRGLLQQWLHDWTGKPRLALILASGLFGICHLGFRDFPNWRFALVVAAAGWFYGQSYCAGRGVRAAMVTHSLTVTAWQTLFR